MNDIYRFCISLMLLLSAMFFLSSAAHAQAGVPRTGGYKGAGTAIFFDADSACKNKSYNWRAGVCTGTGCTCEVFQGGFWVNTNNDATYVLTCPANRPYQNSADNLCYERSPSKCWDGTYSANANQCPVSPQCAVGYVDQGTDPVGKRICTPRICPSPSVLKVDGTCGAPDPNPSAPITPSNKGETGPTGAQGVKGDKGDKGDQGVAGQTGADGAKGDKGDKGETGATGVGVAGAAGATGAKGDRGADGVNGINGRDGAVGATGAAGRDGSNGATGAAGAKGDKGDTGAQGIQGIQGVMGARGMDGSVGLTGAMGLQGVQGIQGETGETGLSFCEANPGLAVCKDSSVSGSCEQVSCSGDAIQCATLRAAATIECRQRTEKDELAGLGVTQEGRAIISGADPMAADVAKTLAGDTVDLGDKRLDGSGFLGGGGACLSNKVFSVMGRPVEMSFTAVCDKLVPLRLAMLAIGAIVSYLIVAKSVLQG